MFRRPQRSTRTDTRFPCTTLFRSELERLLLSCAGNARLSIDEDALDALASAAMGSPYHARLFGMSAALVTEAAARDRMLLSDVEQGLISALEDWEEMSGQTHALFRRILWEAGSSRRMKIGRAHV